jgi:Domain of unknown function (DUF1707)
VVSDGGMRASDSDREKVVEILGAAYTEGRLGLDEFDDRTTAAYSAKTWGELRQLTSDLPAGASLDGQHPAASPDAPRPSLPPGPRPPGREIMFVPFLPVAIVLLILAVSSHAALLFVPMLIVMFALRAARRSHGGGRGPRDSFPPGPGDRVPPRTGGDPL